VPVPGAQAASASVAWALLAQWWAVTVGCSGNHASEGFKAQAVTVTVTFAGLAGLSEMTASGSLDSLEQE
jgi:uncharacterized protein (DUF169 family)